MSIRNKKPIREIHGLIKTKEYHTWSNVKSRCHNPKCRSYYNYGAKGIYMSKEWYESFLSFLEDMGEKPSHEHEIDRIDNSKGYEKGNCKWVLDKENCLNKGDYIKKSNLPRGVYLSRNKQKYSASIGVEGKNYHIGVFNTQEQAHEEFKIMYKEWYGKGLPKTKKSSPIKDIYKE